MMDNAQRDARLFGKREARQPANHVGLTDKEARDFSLLRLIRGAIDPTFRARHAGFEFRAAAEAAAQSDAPVGLMLPREVMELGLRDLSTGTVGAGGALVGDNRPPQYWGTALRAATRVRALGATVVQTQGTFAVPNVDSAATAGWVTEGNAPTETSPTFELMSLSPKTITGFLDVTRRLLVQADPSAEAFIVRELAAALGSAIDVAAINGTGASGQPQGLLGTAGISTIALGTNGAAPTRAALVDMEQTVAALHADGNGSTAGFLTNSRVRRVLRNTEQFAGAGAIWRDGRVLDYLATTTEAVPATLTKGSGTNLSAILYGNWSELFICEFGGVGILVDPVTQGGNIVRVRVMQDLDLAPRRPEAFAAIVDAIAA
jgi:HK97 family phage major capsid protein